MTFEQCLPISQAVGSEITSLHGMERELSPLEHCQHLKPLKKPTRFSRLRRGSLSIQFTSTVKTMMDISLEKSHTSHQEHMPLSDVTTMTSSEPSLEDTRSSRTKIYYGWLNSSEKRLSWTPLSFYKMEAKSPLPPRLKVRRRRSSMVIQSNDASSAS